MNNKLMNIALVSTVAIGAGFGAMLLGTTLLAATTIMSTIALGLGTVALAAVSIQTANILAEAVATDDYKSVDGMAEMIFETIVSNSIRIVFNSIIPSSLVTPRIPKIGKLFGRRNNDVTVTSVDGESGPLTITSF